MRRILLLTCTALALCGQAVAQSEGGGPGGTPGPAANVSSLSGCVYEASPAVATEGKQRGLHCDANGNLQTTGGGGGGGGTSSNFGSTFPTAGTAAGFKATGGTMAAGNLDANGNIRIAGVNAVSTVTGSTSPQTITNSSTQLLAAASRQLLSIDNESATASIACNFGGTAALNTAGSYTIGPGQTRVWNSYPVPADAVNCISSVASSPATVEAN